MFDVGFSELIVIALVALIVVGPERLPRVARTLGALLGRAQRYVNDVKADIQREVDLDELKNIRSTFQDAAKSVKESVNQVGEDLQAAGESLNQSFSGTPESQAEPTAALPPAAGESLTHSISGTPENQVEPTAALPPAAGESLTHSISGTAEDQAEPTTAQPAAAAAADEIETASAQMDLGLESKPAPEPAAPKA
jgi:sec-independent protein translocase protein TatB